MGIGSNLDSLFRNLSPTAVTDAFIVLMVITFMFAVRCARTGKHPSFFEHAPSLLTSLGILGTFLGIVLGLLDFDPSKIEQSIRELLGGLKTAFFTSLVGMLLAVVFKALETFWFADQREAKSEVPTEVTPIHIYAKLKAQLDALRSLEKSIAGSEEGTLVGQIKLLRSDMTDFRSSLTRRQDDFESKLFAEMKGFADLLAKSATEAVVEALRKVIEDFNKHLVEQFGDNFKRLDASVEKLVVWQGTYKTHVEAMEGRIEQAVQSLERTSQANQRISETIQEIEKAISAIGDECNKIPPSMEELRAVMQVNQQQIQELARHLEAFVEMRAKAVDAVPALQAQMERLTEGVKASLDKVLVAMLEGATEFGRHSDRVNSALGETANTISSQSEKIAEDLADAASGFNESARQTLQALESGSREVEAGLTKAVDRASNQITESMTTSIKTMEAKVADAAGSFSDSARKTVQALESGSKAVETGLRAAIEQASMQISQSTTNALKQIEERASAAADRAMRSMAATVEGTVNQVATTIQNSSSKTLGTVEQQVRTASEEVRGTLNAQLAAFQKSLERDLELVISDLAKGLAAISRRLADDHERLTRRLEGR